VANVDQFTKLFLCIYDRHFRLISTALLQYLVNYKIQNNCKIFTPTVEFNLFYIKFRPFW